MSNHGESDQAKADEAEPRYLRVETKQGPRFFFNPRAMTAEEIAAVLCRECFSENNSDADKDLESDAASRQVEADS